MAYILVRAVLRTLTINSDRICKSRVLRVVRARLAGLKSSTTHAVHALYIDVQDIVPDSQRWAFALGDFSTTR